MPKAAARLSAQLCSPCATHHAKRADSSGVGDDNTHTHTPHNSHTPHIHQPSVFLRDGVKAPLALGDVLLADGSVEKGFVGESYGVEGAPDISAHGGWRGFLAAQQAAA